MRRRYIIYGLLFLLSVVTYLDRVVLSIALPGLSKEFDLNPIQQGYLLSSFLWVYILLLIPAGVVLDKLGTRRLIALAVPLWSLATALTAFSFGYVSLLLTRVLLGVGEAPAYPACVRAVREWAPQRERVLATAIFAAGGNFGIATAAVTISLLISVAGWRAAFLASGGIGFVFIAIWLCFYRDPRKARWLREPERAMILAERSPGGIDGNGLSLTALLGYRSLWGLVFVQGCINYVNYFMLTWLPTYLMHSHGMDLIHSGYNYALINIVAGGLTLVFGRLSDKSIRPALAARGGRCYAVVLFSLLASTVLAVPFIESTWLLVIALMVAATGVQSAQTNNYAQLNDIVRQGGGIGKAVSFLQLGGNVFGVMAPIATGYLLATTGSFTSAFLLAGGLLVVGALVSLTMTRRPIGSPIVDMATDPVGGMGLAMSQR
jgi:MFS family permease